MKEFFASSLSTDNKLLKVVEADSKVSEFWAGCRALGLVSTFFFYRAPLEAPRGKNPNTGNE